MNTKRRRISGRLKDVLRGIAAVTDAGDHWVLEDYAPSNDDFGQEVTAAGVVVGRVAGPRASLAICLKSKGYERIRMIFGGQLHDFLAP